MKGKEHILLLAYDMDCQEEVAQSIVVDNNWEKALVDLAHAVEEIGAETNDAKELERMDVKIFMEIGDMIIEQEVVVTCNHNLYNNRIKE